MLYHLSATPNITVLKTKIPKIAMENKNSCYEDAKIQRVCFANSIDNCLTAICPETSKLYVYVPINESEVTIVKPTIHQVFDCEFTGEVWSLKDVPVKCIGVINASFDHMIKTKNEIKDINLPIFNWEWV